ncbi:Uncharacterised protein [Mycobacteroides abscessus subsp. abscessus]|nr:Uncharacterised protein [Mycobacteroides abscessus subsp. abscessus]
MFRWALPDTAHRGSGTQKTPGPHSPVQPWIGYRCPLDRFDVRVRHDIAMATVWVSSTSADVDVDEDRPGDHWQRVGVIDTSAQRDFYTYIQQYIGVRKTTKGKPEFYLSGDPESAWVQQVKENVGAQLPFWILINPYGSGQIHYSSGSIKYLLGADKATLVHSLVPRAPEPHPGLLVTPVALAVKLKRRAGDLFTPCRTR